MPGHGLKGGFRYLGRPAGGEEAQGPVIGGSRVKRGLREDAGLPGLEARQEGQPLGNSKRAPMLPASGLCGGTTWSARRAMFKGAAGFPSDDGCHEASSPRPTLPHPRPLACANLFPLRGKQLGVHRFLVLSFLAHLLACSVRVEGGLTWWEAGRRAARILPPKLVVQVLLLELHALGLWPPGGGGHGVGLCRVCGRCKFLGSNAASSSGVRWIRRGAPTRRF
ncbi:hypothetical protein Theos_2420 (plasmid) [Thermus oshimai JL-2]|jgi:hypothetical protein|uniref:Uncharacterized protein n=1 Tax=Thermus oshimai JL-2 TaxID=751945 RepID=K7RLY8_THEOS|nr:hypothetical protein Theos_2420 [Thermus oshimai JL-2]